jgi:hypothetical protein
MEILKCLDSLPDRQHYTQKLIEIPFFILFKCSILLPNQ